MNQIKINDVVILLTTIKDEKYVAIKPICEAIGVNYTTQLEKILSDDILSSVVPLRGTTGADGKTYEMRVIPLRYVFGWLFTINTNNVKEEARESIRKYKLECYDALFNLFTKRNNILKEKTSAQIEIERLQEELEKDERYTRILELKGHVRDANARLNAMDKNVVTEQLDLFNKDKAE
nr:phage antirepressor N-terminal domain-containing protein [uncultured Flavobacterium sp.]